MKQRRLQLCVLLLLVLKLTGLQAQENVNATGGDALGSGGSVSYSVGQVVYTSNIGTSGSVAQGVQQIYTISEVTELEEAIYISLSVSVYPNPTADYLILNVGEFDISNVSFQLFDMLGKLLYKENITDKQTNIDMSHLISETYFIKVIQGNKEVKTFKIIKQ